MILKSAVLKPDIYIRGESRAAATSKMERFQPLTIITKRSILDVAAVLDPCNGRQQPCSV